MDYETITDAFEALDHKQQLEVLVILTKTAYKGAGGKKISSGAKRTPTEGFLKWNSLVTETYAELKEKNPKTTRSEAMEEAARRLDEMDPEGAPKRATERARRAAKKDEKKDGDNKSVKSSSSKSAKKSSASSAFASDSEEEAPKKKTPAKKPAPVAAPEPESESEAEKVEDSKPDYKGVKVKGKNYILNQSNNAAYEAIDDGEGGFNPGAYAGIYKKENGKASIDTDISEPTA